MSTRVDICICTCRRPGVVATLASLAGQRLADDVTMRVIVADNDETPSAEAPVREAAGHLGLDCLYVHAPARNISIARNAALDAADAPWVAFLDDDETADPEWLAALLAEAAASGAEIVLGPVAPVYRDEAPAWMKAGGFHDTRPVHVGDRIVTGYTCNVLMRAEAEPLRGARFLEALGRSGGEDTEFFDRAVRRGATIAYAPRAILREAVPPEREQFGWLLRRRFRFGQTHGALLAARARSGAGRVGAFALAGAKALCCGAGALATLPWPARRNFWILRGALHAGVMARLAGRRELEQYGLPADA